MLFIESESVLGLRDNPATGPAAETNIYWIEVEPSLNIEVCQYVFTCDFMHAIEITSGQMRSFTFATFYVFLSDILIREFRNREIVIPEEPISFVYIAIRI